MDSESDDNFSNDERGNMIGDERGSDNDGDYGPAEFDYGSETDRDSEHLNDPVGMKDGDDRVGVSDGDDGDNRNDGFDNPVRMNYFEIDEHTGAWWPVLGDLLSRADQLNPRVKTWTNYNSRVAANRRGTLGPDENNHRLSQIKQARRVLQQVRDKKSEQKRPRRNRSQSYTNFLPSKQISVACPSFFFVASFLRPPRLRRRSPGVLCLKCRRNCSCAPLYKMHAVVSPFL